MPEYTEEISAYVTPELKEKFRQESLDRFGKNGQSKNLRKILRDYYAEKEAEQTADDLAIESRLEAVATRLMEDLEAAREQADTEISTAAIYSIAVFELVKLQSGDDTLAREAIRTAVQRVNADPDNVPLAHNADTGTTDPSADASGSDTDGADPGGSPDASGSSTTQAGIQAGWRDDDNGGGE